MDSTLAFQALFTLLYTGALVLVTVVYWMMFFEARRKKSTLFFRWLVFSAMASTSNLVSWLIKTVGPGLGLRSPTFFALCNYGLLTLSTALVIVAVFQIWMLLRSFPMDSGPGLPLVKDFDPRAEAGWPPPPSSL